MDKQTPASGENRGLQAQSVSEARFVSELHFSNPKEDFEFVGETQKRRNRFALRRLFVLSITLEISSPVLFPSVHRAPRASGRHTL